SIYSYFTTNYVPANASIHNNIKKLLPGNFIRIENGIAKLLFALIQEEGSSVNSRFNIQIPCKNTKYTAKEISNAKEPYKAFGLNSPEFKK
mgnify:CR=1